jgi:DNA polymerase-3 subunit alpha
MYLNAHTYFSLRYGVLSPRQLVEAAVARGVKTLTLTDINNTSAALEFVRACQSAGIRPVLGIEFRDAEGRFLFTGIARNNQGWAALCGLLTEHALAEKPMPKTAPPLENCYIVYENEVKPLHVFRPNEFIGIRPAQVNGLHASPWRHRQERLLVWQPVTFLDREGNRLHKLLRAIDHRTLVTKLSELQMARPDALFPPEAELLGHYEQFPKIVQNTRRLLESCSIQFETGLQRNRRSFAGSKDGDVKLLAKLAESGCIRRYGPNHRRAQERVRKELKIIAELDFAAYFLITWDIVRYAESAGYYHVGRGSGANSIVAYCLYITDVEPLELDLYFERFINPQRSSPPDFDIDFSWDERDDVTDYIFKRYGRDYTALLATYCTFQHAAIIRELGKVFGLPPNDIEAILDHWHAAARGMPQQPAQPPLHTWAPHILHYAEQLVDFPNYLSIHAGGIIISEAPLFEATALQLMPKGFPITHFDMYAAEDWGYHKFDVLSQRGLGHIKDCVDIVLQNQGQSINVHDIDKIKNDSRVREQLRSGRCMGCFYIESPAMRSLLHKLRCDDYIHLVAASSIIRPGVARSGMMRAYIERFHQPNAFEYPHPVFAAQLAETFGVMVYQEDVMKILHHFAGLGLGEADIMRRMMTGKKRSSQDFAMLEQKYFDNCKARGYSEALARDVWRQIESFAGYSFCKAHSASFAVESLQSLYLKTYYPLEFMTAVINNFGGFYNTEYYVHEARMAGATVHPPCVNHSAVLTTLSGRELYLGFVHVRGLERQMVQEIVRQRAEFGPFRSLEDFVRRAPCASAQLDILIRIGAFRFTGMKKSELFWEKSRVLHAEAGLGALRLFEDESAEYRLPELEEPADRQAFDELDLLGFSLCSPFDLLCETAQKLPPGILARDMRALEYQIVEMTGYYVCRKDTRTAKGELMQFGTWLDRAGYFFDSVHFPEQARTAPFRGKGVYRLRGRIVSDFGFMSLEVREMERLAFRV